MPVVPGLVRVSSWELSAKRPELILGAGLLCMKWIRCDGFMTRARSASWRWGLGKVGAARTRVSP